MSINEILPLIRSWAVDRNLIPGDPAAQSLKLVEELGETLGAVARLPSARGDEQKEAVLRQKIADGFGDTVVVLTIMAAQLGLSLEDCVAQAYDEIKDRKGKMVNGVFVKEGEA